MYRVNRAEEDQQMNSTDFVSGTEAVWRLYPEVRPKARPVRGCSYPWQPEVASQKMKKTTTRNHEDDEIR